MAPPDDAMGSIIVVELSHGDALDAAASLDEKELTYDSLVQGSEESWLPIPLPPELVKEGTGAELASMGDVGVRRLAPTIEASVDEQRKATPTRWVETWEWLK